MNFYKSHVILFMLFGLYVLLRIPSLFEPHWYADEGIYAAIANAIAHGKKLYIDVFDNRLPGIYYLYMLAGTHRLLIMRLFNFFAGFVTLAGIYFLGLKLQLKQYVLLALLVSVFFLGTPIIEANIANTENFFLPLAVWGLWLILSKKSFHTFLAGVLFGLAFIIKFSPFFTFIGCSVYLFISLGKSLQVKLKQLIILGLGFGSVLISTLLLLLRVGNLTEAVKYGILNNAYYISFYNQKGITLQTRTVGFVFTLILVLVLYLKKKLTDRTFFIFLLVIFDYYAALFSGRKYEHYLLQVVPSLSLLVGLSMLFISRQASRIIKLFLVFSLVTVIVIATKIFYIGTDSSVTMFVVEYYKEFIFSTLSLPYQPKLPFIFFKESSKLESALTSASQYQGKTIYFYSNQSWIWDMAHITPPIFFVAGYHQYLIMDGSQKLINELKKFRPEHIIVDKVDYLSPEMREFLKMHYKNNYENQYFLYYTKMI